MSVDITLEGAVRDHVVGDHASAPLYSCRRTARRYVLRFGNDNRVAFRRGLYLAFTFDPARLGRPQPLRDAELFVELARFRAVSLPLRGWAGTVTLALDTRAGSFRLEGARPVMASGRVSVRGRWTC